MAGTDDRPSETGSSERSEKAWTVTRLNAEIESVLKDASERFPTYVVGEVSEVNPYGFGTFFELRDLDEEAVISCVAWSSAIERFDHDLEDGTEAVVRASVDFYAERGNTQLSVIDYWPLGDSERSRALAALRSKLDAEGLFDDDRKRPLPEYPDHVGVVTSLSGSAREDFEQAVRERSPGVTITLCGASVQGDNAVRSLVGAIQTLDADPEVDVLVVTRGGGSDTDLWCFNEEPVVRTIADCTTPTVVAVGHEDDETLAEAVADRRAMTPTAAGVEVTPNMEAIGERIEGQEQRLNKAYTGLVETRLEDLDRRITTALTTLEQRVATQRATRQRACDLEQRITTAYNTFVDERLDRIDQQIAFAMTNLEHTAETEAVTVQAARRRLGGLETRIDRAYHLAVTQEVDSLERRIEDAYQDIERQAAIEAGAAETRRLQIIVAVLLAVLLIGALLVVVVLL